MFEVLPLAECRILVKSPSEEADPTGAMKDTGLGFILQVVKDHALVDGSSGVAASEACSEHLANLVAIS